MAINPVDRGTAPDNGTGDDLRTGAGKINNNFTYLEQNKADKSQITALETDIAAKETPAGAQAKADAAEANANNYTDSLLQGRKWKDAADVATTQDEVLSGEKTVDGVLTNISRVLVKNQTNKAENGIYISGTGAWTRTADADTGAELEAATLKVLGGTENLNKIFTCNSTSITLGTTNITFAFIGDGVDHNSTTGKQGGQPGEYFHLTQAEKDKLTGIEANATADQTGAEIKQLYEAQPNTNALTDARRDKLDGIPASIEPAFTKNTAFNKDFGQTAGTVAEGNDSRIVNGQTAYGWGDHSQAGYASNAALSTKADKDLSNLTAEEAEAARGKINAASDSDVLHKTGDETKTGDLTLNDALILSQIPEAGNPLVSVNTATGNLNGTYSYLVTFVTANGETNGRGGQSNSVSPVNQQIDITNIPISSDSRVIARRIYRNKLGQDEALKQLVTEIPDNTTTSYTDNVLDSSLGVYVPRVNTTGGIIYNNDVRIALADNQSTAFGYNAMINNTGYANVAFGGNALRSITTGLRNSAFSLYALWQNTIGYENSAFGVHSLDKSIDGNQNVAFGYASLMNNVNGSNNVALGAWAGSAETGSNKLFIDSIPRGGEQSGRDNSLIYGEFSTNRLLQFLRVNGQLHADGLNISGAGESAFVKANGTTLRLPFGSTIGFLNYVDLFTQNETGFWYCQNCTNRPVEANGWLLNFPASSGYRMQIYMTADNNRRVFYNTQLGGVNLWNEIINKAGIEGQISQTARSFAAVQTFDISPVVPTATDPTHAVPLQQVEEIAAASGGGSASTGAFNQTLLFDNVLGKYLEHHTQTAAVNFTKAPSGNVTGGTIHIPFTSDGVNPVNFDSNFDFLYGINSGEALPQGRYEFYFVYKPDGRVTVNVPKGLYRTFNYAYQIDGASQNVTFANSADFVKPLSGAFTISYKVKAIASGGKFAVGVMDDTGRTWSSSWNSSSGDNGYAADFAMFNAGGGSYIQEFCEYNNSLNTMYDVVITYDGSGTRAGIRVYIDGVLDISTAPKGGVTSISTINNVGTFRIGKFTTFQSSGCVVDRMYYVNRVLTTTEISETQGKEIANFSFLTDVVDGWDFSNSLSSVKGTHNGTATIPKYLQV